MTQQQRLLCVLWVLASAGVAGIGTAMTHKSPATTTVQKIEPIQRIDRLLKTDKGKFPSSSTRPNTTTIPTFRDRKYWYA